MRLIDADSLFDYLTQRQKKAIKEDGERFSRFFDIGIFAITNAPTVEAIPIEWLKRWFSFNQWMGSAMGDKIKCNVDDILGDWEKYNALNEWEAENGKR